MKLRSQSRMLRMLAAALVVGLLATTGVACKQTPKDHLREAKGAVLSQKPDEAETHLKAVLKAEPDNFEAKRLMGRVDQLRKNYAKAEEQLKGLWDAQGFGKKDAKLSTKQQGEKQRLEDDLTGLYQAWAGSIDQNDSPDKFEEVVKKGLALDPKKPRLNSMLVSFYENRAKKLVEQGKKLEAANTYAKILKLRTLPSKRKNAKERSTNLRYEANKEQMTKYFETKAKAKLAKEDRYDAEHKTILFSFKQNVSEVEDYIKEKKGKRIRLDARNKKQQPFIQQYALAHKLAPALVDTVSEATGVSKKADFSKVQAPKGFKIVKVDASRHELTIDASMPLDAVLKMGYEIKQQAKKAKEAKAKKGADGAKAEAKAKQAGDKK